jgi:hypothetical protein
MWTTYFPETSSDACLKDMSFLSQQLAKKDHKVSKDKMQLYCQEVKYLGPIVNPSEFLINPDHTSAIRNFPNPIAYHSSPQISMDFLGLIGYCQN